MQWHLLLSCGHKNLTYYLQKAPTRSVKLDHSAIIPVLAFLIRCCRNQSLTIWFLCTWTIIFKWKIRIGSFWNSSVTQLIRFAWHLGELCLTSYEFSSTFLKSVSRPFPFDTHLSCSPLDHTDNQSALFEVMAWCHPAIGHYLIWRWPRSLGYRGLLGYQM